MAQTSTSDRELRDLAAIDGDGERRRHLRGRPALRVAGAGPRLIAEINRALRVDLDLAGRLADTLSWLADEFDDDGCRGFAFRAQGNVLLFRREYRAASEAYRSALERFLAGGNEEEAAATRNALVGSLHPQGLFDEALEMGLSARATFARLGRPLRLARTENNLATLLARQDRFAEALERYRTAHELFAEHGQDSDIGITLRNIAVCLQELNDFDAAGEAYEEARRFCRDHDLPLVAFEVEYNAAYLLFVRGQYARAEALFDRARRECRRLADREHEALCDLDQAEISLELNLPREAGRLARRAGEMFDSLAMGYEAAKALTLRALAASRGGRLEEASRCLRRARRTFERQGNRLWTALADVHLAVVLFREGRRAEARGVAADAYRSFSEVGIPARTAQCELLLAELALADGDAAAAGEHCGSALERLAGLGAPALEARGYLVAGRVAEAKDDRPAAIAAYTRAHEGLERLRGHLGSEAVRVAFLEDKLAIYDGLIDLTLRRDPDDAEAALAWVETAKSRSLADLLAFGSWTLPTTTGETRAVDELRRRREELNWRYRQVDREELEGAERSAARIESLRADILDRERQLLRLLRRLQTEDPDFRSLQGSLAAGLAEIRAALPADALLLEFYIARGRLYALLVDHRRVRVETISPVDQLHGLQQALQTQLRKFALPRQHVDEMRALLERSTRRLLEQMHDLLLAPFVDDLDCRHLVVAPHGPLHLVPFHALFDGERYLIDRFDLSYIPSGTILHLCSRDRGQAPDNGSLVVGVPDDRAPQILAEVRVVAEALPNARLLVGEEATQDNLARLGRRSRYLHLATHGFYRRENPMFSALKLSAGRLSLFDLYGLSFDAELAVLSGCGTGLSSVQGADELVGLTRGLLYAGARTVMVTLWDVHDESTAILMRSFYAHLTGGATPAQALARAMRELRESHPHPYYWAPFVLVGRVVPTSPG